STTTAKYTCQTARPRCFAGGLRLNDLNLGILRGELFQQPLQPRSVFGSDFAEFDPHAHIAVAHFDRAFHAEFGFLGGRFHIHADLGVFGQRRAHAHINPHFADVAEFAVHGVAGLFVGNNVDGTRVTEAAGTASVVAG